MEVRLWFVRETALARQYAKLPPERHPSEDDMIWIPRSLCERTTKLASGEHIIEVVDWFAEKNNL